MMKKKHLLYLLKMLIAIGLTLAVFPFVKKATDLFITSESATTVEAVHLIVFVLIYSAFKGVIADLWVGKNHT